MNFPDPFRKTVTTIVTRRPYDARADVEQYINRLKRADEGMIPPVAGVEIRSVDARQRMREMEEVLKHDWSPPFRDQLDELRRSIAEAFEKGIEVVLYEVGVDPDALKHTARLNEELIRAVEALRAENKELQEQLKRTAEWESTVEMNNEAAIKRERMSRYET